MRWQVLPIASFTACSPVAPGGATADSVGLTQRAHAAAEQCGLDKQDLALVPDSEGQRAFVVQPSAMGRPASSLMCFLRWGEENHIRVGFVSEPPSEKN